MDLYSPLMQRYLKILMQWYLKIQLALRFWGHKQRKYNDHVYCLFCLCPLDLTINRNFNRSVSSIATSAKCDTDIQRFNDLPSLCAHSESSLTTWLAENTKRILCACSENWTLPEVAFLFDQKERGLWEKNAVLLFLQYGNDFVWLPGVILNPRLMAVSTLCLRLCFLHTRNKLSHLLCVPKFEFFEAHFL